MGLSPVLTRLPPASTTVSSNCCLLFLGLGDSHAQRIGDQMGPPIISLCVTPTVVWNHYLYSSSLLYDWLYVRMLVCMQTRNRYISKKFGRYRLLQAEFRPRQTSTKSCPVCVLFIFTKLLSFGYVWNPDISLFNTTNMLNAARNSRHWLSLWKG